MKKIRILLTLLLIILTTHNIYSQQYVDELQSLITKATEVSPKLKMLKAKRDAAVNRIPQQSNLPDPKLTVGLVNLPVNSFSFTQEPMTGKVVGLSQAFPFPGKLSTAEELYEVDVKIIEQEIEETINEIRKQVTIAYYELSFVRKAIEVALINKQLLLYISEVVRTKYEVSKANQQDVLKADLEITKISDKIEELNSLERISLATLRTLLLQKDDLKIKSFALDDSIRFNYDPEQIYKLSEKNRPLLKSIKLMEVKAERMKDLVEYEFYPNFNLSLQYSQRDQITKTKTDLNDFFSIMLGISLPINYGGKKTAAIEESESLKNLFQSQYESALQMLRISLENSLIKMKTMQEREKLITEGFLNQAAQTLNSSLASYQVGKVEFTNVIDAQNKLLEIETNLYRLRSNYYKELAEVEFLIGDKIRS